MSSHKRGGPAKSTGGENFPHQRKMEAAFGEDFSDVQVHTGQRTDLAAIGAEGFAVGNQVAFASSTPTLELLGHELTHVVQQRDGSAQPTTSVRGDRSEQEAVANEARAEAGERIDVSAQPTGAMAGDWALGSLIGAGLGSVLGPGGAIAGGIVGGMIQDAMSDEEEAPAKEAAAKGGEEEAAAEQTPRQLAEEHLRGQGVEGKDLIQRMAGYDIRQNQAVGEDRYFDDQDAVISLDSEEDRTAALNGFTQNHMAAFSGDEAQNMCGSTAMLAAVMMGSGGSGVGDLATSMSQTEGMDRHQREYLEQVAERARNNELTGNDLMALNEQMHSQMQAFDEAAGQGDTPGVTGAAMQHLGAANPAIEQAMQAGRIGMRQIDNDGDGATNHWVLQMQGGTENEAWYDPMALREGPQVRTDAESLTNYRKAARGTLDT